MITYLPHRRKAFQPSGFSPLDLSPVLWLDASDAATISATGGAVDQFSDKSGNGRHYTSTGSQRPTTGSRTVNGRNSLNFTGASGSGQRLDRADALGFVGNPALFVAAAMVYDRIAGYAGDASTLMLRDSASSAGGVVVMSGEVAFRFNNGASVRGAPSTGVPVSIFWGRAAGSDYQSSLAWINNATSAQTSGANGTNTPTLTNDASHIGANYNGATYNYGDFAFCEMIVLSALPTSGQRAQIQSYFAAKWGIS